MDASPTVVEVDERDSHWEDSSPRFRVYIQMKAEPPYSADTATYDLTDCDVADAIAWARTTAREDSTYAVALVVDDRHEELSNPGHGRGLMWILGRDMNSGH
ncbi:hypothetical protein [Nocardioides lijunqiniae]|uniref:hypothetical protein n=1 Tax=Nocardioides lijunqiniae TaxID=2760832 RepID=UPI001878E86D|nr:hypothetical protein [Nocardioides lijunqiniae]